MKVVILAGGFGTRLSEYTDTIPKPMVTIGGKPILLHIMDTYAKFGHKDFYIALGYKAESIKEYFYKYHLLNSDFTVDLSSGEMQLHHQESLDWKVTLIDTGINTMTGGRVKRLKKYLNNETFLLTYGDGVADINLKSLVDFHKSNKKMVTVSAVHPGARFGQLDISGPLVKKFKEKPQTDSGWINGGYFVVEPEFLNFIDNDSTILEREPLEEVSRIGELAAYQHFGFWQCMDTKRDRERLEELWVQGVAPWNFSN